MFLLLNFVCVLQIRRKSNQATDNLNNYLIKYYFKSYLSRICAVQQLSAQLITGVAPFSGTNSIIKVT